MSSTTTGSRRVEREPSLAGQTVVVLGGSAGIGRATARQAYAEGAEVVITGRDRERLDQAALELEGARTAAFDANDPAALEQFFDEIRARSKPA